MIANSFVKNAWYVAGFAEEFKEGELHGPKIAGKPILIYRGKSGKVLAFDNRCAHKRMPLSAGRFLENGTVECAYHGLCYDEKGACVTVPSHPDGNIPPQAKLRPYPLVEQDGVVWIWPGDPARSNDAKPPRTPEIGDSSWETIGCAPMEVPTNYLLLIENLLDITHFYPLHDGNIGDIENSKIPIQVTEGDVEGNHFVMTTREVTNYRQPPFLAEWFTYDLVDRIHTHCMVNPGLTRVEMRVAPPGQLGTEADRGYVLYHTHTPTDSRNHVWRWSVNCKANHMARTDPPKSAAKRVAETFPAVVAQDHWALIKQQEMFEYPDEGYSEVFLKPDKALRRVRQLFTQMQRQEAAAAAEAPQRSAAE